jgi:DNA-binding GntR family transcriptional regulator
VTTQDHDPRPVRRTLSEEAAAILHEQILSGEIPSGTPLRLVELAQRLSMSPMPIREGLRKLAALGLVEIIPHRGAWVRELSVDDLRDTFRTRAELETLAIRHAAPRFTDPDGKAAAELLEEHVRYSLAADPARAREAHTEFHFTLYRAAGSRWLPRAIEPVWQNGERYRPVRVSAERVASQRAEHQAILDACAAHDADAAVTALREHIDNALAWILDQMRPAEDQLRPAEDPSRPAEG